MRLVCHLIPSDGADPFLASPKGETALELAVLAGSLKIVRRFDQEALFAGDVEMMASAVGGNIKYVNIGILFTPLLPLPSVDQDGRHVSRFQAQICRHHAVSGLPPHNRLWTLPEPCPLTALAAEGAAAAVGAL